MGPLHQLQTPPTILYQPDFITIEEEKLLLHRVNSAPKPKWQQLSNRRLQNWGGIPHPKGMIAEPLPEWLSTYVNRVAELEIFGEKRPNHVLVNEYLPGQGILPHTDGPLFEPIITTISLCSSTVLDFYQQQVGDSFERFKTLSVFLEPRSLVVVKDDMYTNHMHAISESTCDIIDESVVNRGCRTVGDTIERTTRVSLTIRHVPKTSKARILSGR